ncbi:hypothetical protein B9Z55_022092 [Caenorhabditis nigoni]|uniref:Uncharacterized protein n=1 Tax=Caenorhabditis nigoni TaxID=1611254 RepID=A0A2G5TUT8_9PELO|nr:hypothetical protein B9Z55_022092 [Caenorhabditis nigoni]
MGYGRKGMTNHMPEMCVFTSQAPKDNSRRRPADKREIHRSNTDVKKRREASPRSSNFRPTMKHISSSEEIDGGGPSARVLQQIHHRNHAGSSSSFELQGRNQGSSGEGVHQTPDVLKRIQEVQKLLLNMQEDELDQRQMNKGTSYRGQRY